MEIIKWIDVNYKNKELKLRDKVILQLMYDGGCRIGEVLGLTLEDISLYKTKNANYVGIIKIRNRLSDKLFQSSKTCMKITSLNDYRKNEYQTKNVGFQETYISYQTYQMLIDYIDVSRGKDIKGSFADSVERTTFSNEYVFLNLRTKTVLNISTWNMNLRKIFVANNLPIDVGVKKNGLNHLFRHGFAMKLLYDCNYRIEMVQKRMRHKNQSSTLIYINPTDEQIAEMKIKFEDEKLNNDKKN